ncbi:hypothetical protein [Butyrivibrio sp. MC2021]|uniref:hypothetical protein n=1 Tax=Butyrivibrio sp. MC2021 TaxID=1408306 RepID=UPI00047AB51B|nr:hypothetical protein [Butyrivibrio sp. MC2021]
MIGKKSIVSGLIAGIVFMTCLTGSKFDVSAAGNNVVTLSGTFSGSRTVSQDTGTLILDNVHATNEDNIVYLPDGITIELKEGTENGVYCLLGEGDITIVGSGKLNEGCGIITNSGTIRIELTDPGAIDLKVGMLMNYEGSIIIESGTVVLGGDGFLGGKIAALGGDVRINGGNVSVGGSSIGLYSEGKVQFAGGEVTAGGAQMAVMALEGIEQDNGNPEQLDIIVSDNESGGQVSYVSTNEGTFAKSLKLSEDEVIVTDNEDISLLSAPESEFSKQMAETMSEQVVTEEDIQKIEEALIEEGVDPYDGVNLPEGTVVAKAEKELSPVKIIESRPGELQGQENSKMIGGFWYRMKWPIILCGSLLTGTIIAIIILLIVNRKRI